MKTLFNFQNGKVKFNLTKINPFGERFSFWTIEEGNFVCESCGAEFKKNDEVLPVFWKKEPTNFVCNKCRGILKILSPVS